MTICPYRRLSLAFQLCPKSTTNCTRESSSLWWVEYTWDSLFNSICPQECYSDIPVLMVVWDLLYHALRRDEISGRGTSQRKRPNGPLYYVEDGIQGADCIFNHNITYRPRKVYLSSNSVLGIPDRSSQELYCNHADGVQSPSGLVNLGGSGQACGCPFFRLSSLRRSSSSLSH